MPPHITQECGGGVGGDGSVRHLRVKITTPSIDDGELIDFEWPEVACASRASDQQ